MQPGKLSSDQAKWLLNLTATAARAQAERILNRLSISSSAPVDVQMHGDVWLFAIALHAHKRALKALKMERPSNKAIEKALDLVSFELEDLDTVRHALEHAEDWLRGTGGLGKTKRKVVEYGYLVQVDGSDLTIAILDEAGRYHSLSVRRCLGVLDEVHVVLSVG